MRKFLLASIFAVVVGMLCYNTSYGEVIIPLSVTDSGCKNSDNTTSTPLHEYGEEQISWTVSYNEGKLVIVWHDCVFDCAAYDFGSQITREGDVLTCNVWAKDGMADCLCLYDITSTYDGIEPGKYTLVFEDIMSIELNLEDGFNGNFKISPSGIDAISHAERKLKVEDGVAKVSCPGKFRLDIFSSNGVKEFTVDNEGEAEVNLSGLGKGLHYLRLTPAEGKVVAIPVLR